MQNPVVPEEVVIVMAWIGSLLASICVLEIDHTNLYSLIVGKRNQRRRGKARQGVVTRQGVIKRQGVIIRQGVIARQGVVCSKARRRNKGRGCNKAIRRRSVIVTAEEREQRQVFIVVRLWSAYSFARAILSSIGRSKVTTKVRALPKQISFRLSGSHSQHSALRTPLSHVPSESH